LTGATGCAVNRLCQTSGRPMQVEDILAEIRRLAKVEVPAERRFAAA
jgi:hypothetical protein